MVKSKSIFNRISSNLNQAEGEKGEMVDELHDNKSVNSETRSQTNSWLKEKGLSEFVQKLRSEKLEIETLFECSRDELFEIFKGIGLKPQECVRLRFAVTSDKRWKGGLDVLFALKEKTYREVQQISKELAKSSITLSKVEDAKIAVSKTCDDYLKEITDAVEKIRTDAYLQIERVRTKNEEKMKTLTEAQREIQSVVQKLPIHDDKGRDKGICKIMKTVQNQLLENAEFRVDGLKAVKPDISKLKEAVSSYCIFTRKRKQFMWDAECKSSWVSVSNKRRKSIVNPDDVPIFKPHMSAEAASKLKIGSNIDFRDHVGRSFRSKITGINPKNNKFIIHYEGFADKWDTETDVKELWRFCEYDTLNRRPVYRKEFIDLGPSDMIDVNSRRHPGWRNGTIRRIDKSKKTGLRSSGWVQVQYKSGTKQYLYWVHLDNPEEVAPFATKANPNSEEEMKVINNM